MSRLYLRGWHLALFDLGATAVTILLAFAIRFEPNDLAASVAPYLPVALLPLVVSPVTNAAFGLYRREWRYASVREMVAIVAAVGTSTAATAAITIILANMGRAGAAGFPRSVFAIEVLLSAALMGGIRFLVRVNTEHGYGVDEDGPGQTPTLVYGAGEAGVTTLRLARRDPRARIKVVGFLDDDRRKRGSALMGVRIFGGLELLTQAVESTGATQLLVAMPSAPGQVIRAAVEAAGDAGIETRTIPPLRELIQGRVDLDRIRPVRVEDLLQRRPVESNSEAVAAYVNGASVLVTGGGGSIGSELVRQILELGPRQLTVLDNHEAALWNVERMIAESHPQAADGGGVELVFGDIRFSGDLDQLIRRTRPDIVFHAAALKHVPIVERYPTGAVLTNVVGTRTVVQTCERYRVGRLVFVSTDKAVDPASLMGATKRIGELLTQQAARRSGLPYVAVRFGNVLGSSGSVVPTLERQLRAGMPLTITHPDATRYFMTIGEAVALILQSGALAEPGEVFVLEMGDPIRIVDLARDIARLAGMDPNTADIVYTGLRPGERLHEQLFNAAETSEPTRHAGIVRVRSSKRIEDGDLDALVNELDAAARDGDETTIRRLLQNERASLTARAGRLVDEPANA